MNNVIDMQARRVRASRAAYKAKKQVLIKELGEPTSNFFRVSHLTISNKRFQAMSLKAQVLFFILCAHRNRFQRNKTYFTRSIRQLAVDLNMSKNTVKLARNELKEAGYVIYVNRPSGRTRWQLVDERAGKSLI